MTSQKNKNIIESPVGQFALQAALLSKITKLGKLLEDRPVNGLPFEYILLPGQGARITEPAPNGTIRTVQIHWPDGCNGLVGVAVWLGVRQIVPQNGSGYLALNDATPTYAINLVKTTLSDQIIVDMYNADAANSHHIVVIIGIEED